MTNRDKPCLADCAGRVRGLVFDFDGTLASLVIDFALMKRRVMELAARYGRGPEDFDGRYILEGVAVARDALAAESPERAYDFERKAGELIEDMEIEAAGRGELFPDARPSLAALREAGFGLAVITRNFGRAVLQVFPDLQVYCPVFIPRDRTPRVKPDPAHLSAALVGLGLSPGETIMVGDHPIDIAAGRALGALTAGVASGRMTREDLAGAGADFVFDGLGDLVAGLLGRLSDGQDS